MRVQLRMNKTYANKYKMARSIPDGVIGVIDITRDESNMLRKIAADALNCDG